MKTQLQSNDQQAKAPTKSNRAQWMVLGLIVAASPLTQAQIGYSNLSQAMNAEWAAYVTAELQSAAGVEGVRQLTPEHSLSQALRAAITHEINTTLQLSTDSALQLKIQDSFGVGRQTLTARAIGAAQQSSIAPTVVHQLNDQLQLAVGGIFTYETFSSAGLASSDRHDLYGQESTFGTSMFVGLATQRYNGFAANISARSKTQMDPYRSYRGVFAEAGRFDLPSRLSAGLSYDFSPSLRVDVSADRVGFADTQPFTSDLLPEAFVALLGDSNSPNFKWSDLTVYRAQMQWTPSRNQLLQLGWYSSEQPEPTSELLRRALRDEFSDQNLQLSYGLGFARNAHLKLSASYAEGGYFFGPSLLQARDYQSGRQFEAEALVRVDF